MKQKNGTTFVLVQMLQWPMANTWETTISKKSQCFHMKMSVIFSPCIERKQDQNFTRCPSSRSTHVFHYPNRVCSWCAITWAGILCLSDPADLFCGASNSSSWWCLSLRLPSGSPCAAILGYLFFLSLIFPICSIKSGA